MANNNDYLSYEGLLELKSKMDITYATKGEIPTSINGLGGGELTSPLIINGGDNATAHKIVLGTTGQITDTGTATLFGRTNASTLIVGHSSLSLNIRGSATRPTYNGNSLALYSDVSSKQDTLVSGTNIKTINGNSVLGSGDLVISGRSGEGWTYMGDYDGFSLASPSDEYTASITDAGFKVGRGPTDAEDWILEINQDYFEYNVDGAKFGYDINNSLFYITSVGGFEYNGNKVITSNDVGGGITYDSTNKILKHTNSVSAGTIGSSTASSGATLSVPYATYDANGHIKAKGTHTHTINAIKSFASRGSTGGTNRLDYDGLHIFIPYGEGVAQTSGRIGASSSSYTTFYGIAYGYLSVGTTATSTTYLYLVYRSSATGGWTTKTISWTGFSAYLMNVQVIRIVA